MSQAETTESVVTLPEPVALSEETATTREELTEKIVATKLAKDLTWEQLAEALGRSKVWATAALLGQMQMNLEEAQAAAKLLDLDAFETKLLATCPYRGSLGQEVPTDALVYRFYEIIQVYGTTLKAVIEEEFGDGIMSAIDFSMDVERVPDPNGDRVKVTMNGKFLPYKRY
ncbi:MAG: cyanase [Alphaproteobacteria bacterium]|nr:cyanase [Alphaproteobacteria bacterium]